MKKFTSFLLVFIILIYLLTSCNGNTIEPPINNFSPEELEEITNPNFSSEPFAIIKEHNSKYTNDELNKIISKIPSDKYEIYPYLHNVPLTATLYKNGEIAFIDATDPRLIRLINFYNNSVYHRQYNYSQGFLDIDYLNENVLNEEFRLVLTFTTNSDTTVHYDTNVWTYGTFVITNNDIILINYNSKGYEGQENRYPFRSVLHEPLGNEYTWLDLFGF